MSNYNRIRDLREDESLTQKQISEKLYMHLTQYRRYEKGESEVPLCVAIQIAKLYDVSIDYIAGLTNDKGGNHCNFLDSREKELIQNWRKISVKQQNRILDEIEDYLEEPPRTTAKKSVI